MDPQELVERRLDRHVGQDDRARDRRTTLWVAGIAFLGVILSTFGAGLGAKWGTSAALEVQQRDFAEQKRGEARDLCVELGTEIAKTNAAVSTASEKEDPLDVLRNEAARWEALDQRAAAYAPGPIWLSVDSLNASIEDAYLYESWHRAPRHYDPPGGAPASLWREQVKVEVQRLRNACRTEQGQDPVPLIHTLGVGGGWHGTLAANMAESFRFTSAGRTVELRNLDSTAVIFYRLDGKVPTVNGVDAFRLGPDERLEVDLPRDVNPPQVTLITSGTPTYEVSTL